MTKEDGEGEGNDESRAITRSKSKAKSKDRRKHRGKLDASVRAEIDGKGKVSDDVDEGEGRRGDEAGHDDDESNADLSLKIVAKAERRRKRPLAVESGNVRNVDAVDFSPNLVSSVSEGERRRGDGAGHDDEEANVDLSLKIVAKAERRRKRAFVEEPGDVREDAPDFSFNLVDGLFEGEWRNGDDEGQDDDEGNAGLSRKIVAKVERRRKRPLVEESGDVRNEDALNLSPSLVAGVSEGDDVHQMDDEEHVRRYGAGGAWQLSASMAEEVKVGEGGGKPVLRSESPEEGELQEDAVENSLNALESPEIDEIQPENRSKSKKKEKKKEKMEKKERRKKMKEIELSRRNAEKASVLLEFRDGIVQEESKVMRRLLRGPRYFDPPEEQGQSCFNCGNVGHLAASCPEGPRLKPCYVCGGFGHDGRECPQKTECFVCKKVGHIAKNCPGKGSRLSAGRDGDNVCLKCGRGGHEASACRHDYDQGDLMQVQCYICKNFGHLCCAIVVDASPLPVSCYDCGEMGHTGDGCARPRWNDSRERAPASVCFRCGEEGHYARGCSKRKGPTWPPPWSPDAQGYAGGSHGSAGPRYQLPLSVGESLPRWMDLQHRESRRSSFRKESNRRWGGSRLSRDDDEYLEEDMVDFDDLDLRYTRPIEWPKVDLSPPSPNAGYRNRRKRRWTSTTAR